MAGKFHKDLAGSRFGRLVAAWPCGRKVYSQSSQVLWLVVCDCGNMKVVYSRSLTSGGTSSCGCLMRELSSVRLREMTQTHGQRCTPTYVTWCKMRERCHNPKSNRYEYYGGRGIQVCERWGKFEDFLADMGKRPPGTSIDRINNNGNYEPSNCRWATCVEQNQNRRKPDTRKL